MSQERTIPELLATPASEHDLEWLKASLQAAIQLEFATIPPYLSAYWSIEEPGDSVAKSIRVIWREEMLHMGLACNLLAGIGGTPWLNTPGAIPTYPGELPGDVQPGLIVKLQGLSKPALETFMQIEYPEGGPIGFEAAYASIGAFYAAIQVAFDTLQPALAPAKQLSGWLGLSKITTLVQVRQAIDTIKRQGEGSKDSPEDTGVGDLAHYYRFREVVEGKKLVKNPTTGKWGFHGNPIAMPVAWPMAEVPAGGYKKEQVAPPVWEKLDEFDRAFTTMLNQLQSAWEGNSDDLTAAVMTMSDLGGPAVALMQMPIPGTTGTYGPCFRRVPAA